MSSSGGFSGGGGGDGATPQLYFCYQCNRTVSITPSPASDLICPNCSDTFLEEVENPNPNPNPSPSSVLNPFFPFPSDFSPFSTGTGGSGGFPLVFSSGQPAGARGGPVFDDLSSLFGGAPTRSAMFQDPEGFNPFVFLQNYLQTLRAGGANIQFVIENNSGDPGSRLPGNLNLGDYFIGPGLEQLIQQLAENDPNRYGTPPASKLAVEGLPNIKFSEELLASDSSQCAVCKDTFELGEEAKQMPCKHIYHSDCILPWLELHNSCPVCRYELPTDDQDYEQRAGGAPAAGNQSRVVGGSAESSGGGDGESPLTPRRFRISLPLPWPFRGSGSSAETSNSRSGGNNENNDGESNSGNRGTGPETRQEDLD